MSEILFLWNLLSLRDSIFFFLIKLICVNCGLNELDAILDATVEEVQSNISQTKISIGTIVGLQEGDVEAVVEGECFEGGEEHFNEATVEPESGLGFALFERGYKVILDEFSGLILAADFELRVFAVGSLELIEALLLLKNGFLVHFDKIVVNKGLLNIWKVRLQSVEFKPLNKNVIFPLFLYDL